MTAHARDLRDLFLAKEEKFEAERDWRTWSSEKLREKAEGVLGGSGVDKRAAMWERGRVEVLR